MTVRSNKVDPNPVYVTLSEYMTNTSKNNLDIVFGLVQLYGRTLSSLDSIIKGEEGILERNTFCAVNVGKLLRLRTLRCQAWTTLQAIALELESRHGVTMPSISGWDVIDEDRFYIDPFPSPTNVYHCKS